MDSVSQDGEGGSSKRAKKSKKADQCWQRQSGRDCPSAAAFVSAASLPR